MTSAEAERVAIADENVIPGDFSTIFGWTRNSARHGLRFGDVRVTGPGMWSSYAGQDVLFFRSTNDGYLGRFAANQYHPDPRAPAAAQERVRTILRGLAQNPLAYAASEGRRMGRCCFCFRELTDERSVVAGYGQICAERHGLTWGTTHAVEINAERAAEHALATRANPVLDPMRRLASGVENTRQAALSGASVTTSLVANSQHRLQREIDRARSDIERISRQTTAATNDPNGPDAEDQEFM